MSLTASRAVMLGIRVGTTNRAATTWAYVAVAGVSLPIGLVVGGIVQERFGFSLAASDLVRRADPMLVLELWRDRRHALETLAPLLIGTVIVWTVLSTYLAGAILASVARADRARTGEFFAGGGRVFGRLLRLLALGLPFVLLAGGLPSFGLYKVVNVATENMVSEKAVFALRLITLFLALAFIGWASGAYDLMRIEAVARGEHRARYAFVRGLFRAARHPFALVSVAVPFALAVLMITVIGYLIEVHVVTGSWVLIWIMIVLEQAIAYFRALLRVSLAASEVALVSLLDEDSRRAPAG